MNLMGKMSHRLSTVVQDGKIMRLLLSGMEPKRIVRRLHLPSIHAVYNAIKRSRSPKNIAPQTVADFLSLREKQSPGIAPGAR